MAVASIGDNPAIPGYDWNTEVARGCQRCRATLPLPESSDSPMDHVLVGNKGFTGDRRRQIYFRRDGDRPSQKPVQLLYLSRPGPGRHEDGHGHTPLSNNNPLQFSAVNPIEDIQAFRLELAGADDPIGGHFPLQVVISVDRKLTNHTRVSRSKEQSARLCVSARLGSPADEFNVTEGVDAGLEGAADDGRGLVFGDDGGTGDEGAGLEIAAVMDCDLNEFAGLGIEDGADARGLG